MRAVRDNLVLTAIVLAFPSVTAIATALPRRGPVLRLAGARVLAFVTRPPLLFHDRPPPPAAALADRGRFVLACAAPRLAAFKPPLQLASRVALTAMPPSARGQIAAGAKRKATSADHAPGVKRGKHSAEAGLARAEDDEVIVIDDEGSGAFAPRKSSGYSAAQDPQTAQLEAAALGLSEWQVRGALKLLADGSTVPFISRYRKEATGAMDEAQLRALVAGLERRQKVGDRRAAIVDSLKKAQTLTPELHSKLTAATSLAELEDIYLPLRPKRRTRASDAKDKGLDDLALVMMACLPAGTHSPPAGANPYQHGPSWLASDPIVTARRFLKHQAEVGDVRAAGMSAEDALAGARDIVAQVWAEDLQVRTRAREPNFLRRALQLTSRERKKGADGEGNYKVYHEYARPLTSAPPHAILALARGDRDKILSLKLVHGTHEQGVLLRFIYSQVSARGAFAMSGAWKEHMQRAVADGVERLLLPALEREWWKEAVELAEEASFKTFAVNLRSRLLQPPVKGCTVLGIDPGLRTGCKAALVSPTGTVLDTLTFFPLQGGGDSAAKQIAAMLQGCKPSDDGILVALGNGKGSRDAEQLLHTRVKALLPPSLMVRVAIVDEGGASVYSASELAGAELPALDVTLRGAVSIARRLLDPLSELVKIEPKALGVGLYQHDVNQKRLSLELADVVVSAVNAVGVDVNTASPALLQYVAGLNAKVAKAVVTHRELAGAFVSRDAIRQVKGLGPKSFEQAAGFLRVYGSADPLDATAIHPESYRVAKTALASLALTAGAPMPEASQLADMRKQLGAAGVQVGEHTLADIVEALRSDAAADPRDTLLGVPPPMLEPLTASRKPPAGGKGSEGKGLAAVDEGRGGGVSVGDLVGGMRMSGIVRNVVAFGAFIDIGVQQDALLHVSKLPRGAPPLQVGQRVPVVVEDVQRPAARDAGGKTRISLRMGNKS